MDFEPRAFEVKQHRKFQRDFPELPLPPALWLCRNSRELIELLPMFLASFIQLSAVMNNLVSL